MDTKEFLLKQGNQLFTKRIGLLNQWQDIAENFYPERADFTVVRNVGDELARGLATGYPVLCRRDLGNQLGGMLRPTNKTWAHARITPWDSVSTEARAWLEKAEIRMFQAMYHSTTQFNRALSQADHDYAAFGQAVIQLTLNSKANGLLYRCWHLRDVAWMENTDGAIGCVYRKWKPTVLDLSRMFKNVHPKVKEKLEKDPYSEVDVWHCMVPSDSYLSQEGKNYRAPFVSVYLDVTNQHIMEEVGAKRLGYMIPRWQTVSGSQYAYSPAVVVALADARTLQEMTITLLEAGEKFVSPPMLAVQGALRGDINVMAAGVTWVDREYDERLGEVLRPLTQDKSGMPIGHEMASDIREQIMNAFYLNKLGLPPSDHEMTAYETAQRVQEYIRHALPLFEPTEMEYNAPVCDNTFEMLFENGVFGSPYEVPEELRGTEVKFEFESPLHDAIEQQKGQKFMEAAGLMANAAAADPGVRHIINMQKATRDAILGIGTPATWLKSEGEVADLVAQDAQNAQSAALLTQMQQGAMVAKTLSDITPPTGGAPA